MRRLITMMLVALVGLAVCGCTSETGDSPVDVALQSPFAPVVISILRKQAPKIKGSAGIAVLVGSYELDALRKDSLKKRDSTFLILRHEIAGTSKVTVFRFDSRHKIRVALNGKFDEQIYQNVITLAVDPRLTQPSC